MNSLAADTAAGGPRAPWLRRTAAVIGGLALTTIALQSAAGFVIGKANPALGQTLSPGHYAPLSQAAENALQSTAAGQDPRAVRTMALRAIVRGPLDHRSARTIALLDKASGFEAGSRQVLKLVGRATLHDTYAHAFLLDDAFKRGDFVNAVREADIVMRTDPQVRAEAHKMLNTIVADGRAVPDLARKLMLDPQWRPQYLETLGAAGTSPANEERLFRMLRASAAPPRASELRPWFMRRALATPASTLRGLYDALSPMPFPPDERLIRNGDFSGSKIIEPYNWTVFVTDKSAGEIGPGPMGPDKALYVEFDRNAVHGAASQLLTLVPGRYRFTARIYAVTELSRDNGLVLACINGGQPQELLRMPLAGTVEDWRPLSWDVDIPAGCQGPLLSVARQAGRVSKLEQFYLDDIVVKPLAGPAPAKPAATK